MKVPQRSSIQGFSMVELLMVIITIGIIGTIALPMYMDFQQEAKVATSRNYLSNIKSAINLKRQQMILRCNVGPGRWPTATSINLNDITENGSGEALCSMAQLGNDSTQAKFLDQGEVSIPINPFNGRNDIVSAAFTDLCSLDPSAAGYYYNEETGEIGHPQISTSCTGDGYAVVVVSGSSSSNNSSEFSSSSSSEVDCNYGYSFSADTLCYNACGQVVNDWICIGSSSSGSNCSSYYTLNEGTCVYNNNMDDGYGGCTTSVEYVEVEQCNNAGVYESSSSSSESSCSASGFDSAHWNGTECIGCWSYQSFDGTSCVDPPGCTNAGGYWAPGDSQCSCPSGLTWDGSNCADPNSSSSEDSSSSGCSDTYVFDGNACIHTHYAYGSCEVLSSDSVDWSMCGVSSSSEESSSEESSSEGSSYSGNQGAEGCTDYYGLERYTEISGQCYSVGMCTAGDLAGQEVTPGYPSSPNGSPPCY